MTGVQTCALPISCAASTPLGCEVAGVGVRANLLSNDTWKGVLRANYGQGYRVPNLKERHYLFDHSSLGYIVLGNPNLKPESSNSFQLGGQLSWRDRVTLDANLFYNRVTDLIQTDMANFTMFNGIAVYTYRNVARARTQGAETSDRKSTRLNSSHIPLSRMPSSA